VADLGLHVQLGPATTEWVTGTVLVADAQPPRAPLLMRLAAAIESRLGQSSDEVLDVYRARSATLETAVCARLIPLGPGGPEVRGEAVDVLADGALVILTARGNRVAVRPQNLGLLDAGEGEFGGDAKNPVFQQ
jgi:BirA family biotin operon repressor/biotin-[acetyl-CoA-carboxylase] ligase